MLKEIYLIHTYVLKNEIDYIRIMAILNTIEAKNVFLRHNNINVNIYILLINSNSNCSSNDANKDQLRLMSLIIERKTHVFPRQYQHYTEKQ